MINILDEKVINKIAAGEVIERPASVVKELIENSLDAKSSKIEIHIEDYGKRLIKVSDDGTGMSKEDAKLSVLRYATSKIKDENDILNIETLGFRGEALASIGAISNLTISTKMPNELEGFKIEIEGGKFLSSMPQGRPAGTTIEVRDLFFNTPARLKFLRTDNNELNHIVDIVTRYGLANPNISIKLMHNNHILLNSPKNFSALDNIASIYGIEIVKQLIGIHFLKKDIEITGFISKPSLLKSDKSMQSIYVNNRFVKDDIMTKAIYDAYHTLLFVNRHPVAILNIKLNPETIDVNVHPTKEKIKFAENERIYETIFNAIRDTLLNNNLIVDFSAIEDNQKLNFENKGFNNQKFQTPNVKPTKAEIYTSKDIQGTISLPAEKIKRKNKKLPEIRLIGQIFKTFFLGETKNGLLLIDQHIVHERINYEKFMQQLMNKQIKIQSLLSPLIVNLPPKESVFLKNNLQDINQFGFEINNFEGNSFIVRSVPSILNKIQTKESFEELISDLANEKDLSLEKKQEEIITRMACRASIKAGEEISIPQMEKLLEELDECEQPYTCPHGRPIFVNLTLNDLEKMFKRK
ncbi:MAG: DNA mismatch repair endonuclease MutL [Nanoarchaeota archaeon]|nr:DNA mismatch repair endonuclease MutL [Nanoarchaeota archaeon]